MYKTCASQQNNKQPFSVACVSTTEHLPPFTDTLDTSFQIHHVIPSRVNEADFWMDRKLDYSIKVG